MNPRHWSANAWVLIILSVFLIGMVAEAGLNVVRGKRARQDAVQALRRSQQPFPLGSEAPAFELPDAQGKKHRLADFRGQYTVLSFSCGCSACTEMGKQLDRLVKDASARGKAKPAVIIVATFSPESEASRRRRMGNPNFLFLYDGQDRKVGNMYAGHPCPRTFVLDPEQRVRYISPYMEPGMEQMLAPYYGNQVAEALGLKPRGTAAASAPTAPAGPSPNASPVNAAAAPNPDRRADAQPHGEHDPPGHGH